MHTHHLDCLSPNEIETAQNERAETSCGNLSAPVPRPKIDPPFAWLNRPTLRRLAESFGEEEANALPTVRSVLLALAELSSSAQSARFQVSRRAIASRAGVLSVRTVCAALARLERLRIITIERVSTTGGQPDAPSFYTLLAEGNGCPPREQQTLARRQPGKNDPSAHILNKKGRKVEIQNGKEGYAHAF